MSLGVSHVLYEDMGVRILGTYPSHPSIESWGMGVS